MKKSKAARELKKTVGLLWRGGNYWLRIVIIGLLAWPLILMIMSLFAAPRNAIASVALAGPLLATLILLLRWPLIWPIINNVWVVQRLGKPLTKLLLFTLGLEAASGVFFSVMPFHVSRMSIPLFFLCCLGALLLWFSSWSFGRWISVGLMIGAGIVGREFFMPVKPWPVALRLITDEEAARTLEIVVRPGDPPLGIVLHNDRWTPIIRFQGGQRTYEEYPRELHYEYFLAPRDETGKEYPASPSRLVRFRGPDGDLLKVTCR